MKSGYTVPIYSTEVLCIELPLKEAERIKKKLQKLGVKVGKVKEIVIDQNGYQTKH